MTRSKARSPRSSSPSKLKARQLPKIDHDIVALVLQGGGALGAYQAGVYEGLSQLERQLNWVAGVSIGSINAALIAGNEPMLRLARLEEFWNEVTSSSGLFAPVFDVQWSTFHQLGSLIALSTGVPGFFKPWPLPPFFQPEGSDPALSFYDTAPLRATLERLVDFDLLNSGRVRISLGAVNLRTGNSEYFDSAQQLITLEHVMASCALPPAFAPVLIDGEYYWDGGIVSNTPLNYVLDNCDLKKTIALQVDLFSTRGRVPRNIGAAMSRHKDIQYASRTRMGTDRATELRHFKNTVHHTIEQLPAAIKNQANIKQLLQISRTARVDIVHLIYRQDQYELESKDYDFSRATMLAHWQAGLRDMERTVTHPEWLKKCSDDTGVTVYDLAHAKA